MSDHTFIAINYLPEPDDLRLCQPVGAAEPAPYIEQILGLFATLSPGTIPVLLLIPGQFGAKP